MPRARSSSLTGPQLRALRQAAGLSGPALAKLLGVSYQTVRNVESGKYDRAGPLYVRLLTLLTYEPIRQLVPLAEAQAKKIVEGVEKAQNTPCNGT